MQFWKGLYKDIVNMEMLQRKLLYKQSLMPVKGMESPNSTFSMSFIHIEAKK